MLLAVDLQFDLASEHQDRLIALFKRLHSHPELSMQETKAAALIASELRANGFEVEEGINLTGVTGVMRNGPGPVVLYRADMDALPIREESGLPYASVPTGKTNEGVETPVAHACGHDAHVTWLIGVAKVMAARKADWSGTLILLGQPGEEGYGGAMGMVNDGLYSKIPEPSVIFAAHTNPIWPAGAVGLGSGHRMAGADEMLVTLHGVGGHASTPHLAKDPIVMAAQAILSYQTIVSRGVDQTEPAVLTVGSIEAGTAANIIPDSARMRITLRWYSTKVRDQMVAQVKRVTDGIAQGSGMGDRMPEYEIVHSVTPVVNDNALVAQIRPVLRQALGFGKVYPGLPMQMASEDFQMLGAPLSNVRFLHLEVGVAKPTVLATYLLTGALPEEINHHPAFRVELPAIAAGVRANSAVLLELLKTDREQGEPPTEDPVPAEIVGDAAR